MAVRVKIKITLSNEKSLETTALVNTGFESIEPQLLLPVKAAEKLGIWPNLPKDAVIEFTILPMVQQEFIRYNVLSK